LAFLLAAVAPSSEAAHIPLFVSLSSLLHSSIKSC